MATDSNGFSPLTVAEYSVQALSSDQRSDQGSLSFPLLGLFGETGSLLSEVKKKQRDRTSYLGFAGAVVEEFGDVLWYLNTVASRGGLTLETVMATAVTGSSAGVREGPLTLASLQPAIIRRSAEPTAKFEHTLLRLAGEVGLLVAEHEAGRLAATAGLADRLAGITLILIQAANEAGVTLEAAAVKNLAKVFDRWPRERIYPEPLDSGAELEERLPRDLYVEIFERQVRGRTYVFQRCNGINIGD